MSVSLIPEVEFSRIRSHEGSQHRAFEELSVQLFRRIDVPVCEYYRVDDAGGDGGVEDLAMYSDGSCVGMQAKYFEKLSPSQWSQMDKSVRTALRAQLPRLQAYHFYVPCNRPKDSKSWNNYTTKWNGFAVSLGYPDGYVQYVWHGKSEIHDELMPESMRPFLHYWFGAELFSHDWLLEKFAASRAQIDERYTPRMHVRTDAELQLDAFLLTDSFAERFLNKFRRLVSACRKDLSYCSDIAKEREQLADLTTRFASLVEQPLEAISQSGTIEFLDELQGLLYSSYEKYRELEKEEENKPLDDRHKDYGWGSKYSSQFHTLDQLSSLCSESRNFIEKYKIYESHYLLVTGQAGSGKSHLLTRAVEVALERQQPCILFAGEQFNGQATPQNQICEMLAWDSGIESLLSALECTANISGKPAIIAIDAINESGQRGLWRKHLYAFAGLIRKYPKIRLLVSCRSDFVPLTLPSALVEGRDDEWGRMEHTGFDMNVFEAVKTYFKGYSVSAKQFPPLLEEFKNPLFLKTLCEAYQGQEIPDGKYAFVEVMEKRIQHCCEAISQAIDCSKRKTRSALLQIASLIAENSGNAVKVENVEEITEALFFSNKESQSLYHHLKSNRMLFETYVHVHGDEGHSSFVAVRFPYERFSDYLIAQQMLSSFSSLNELREAWTVIGLPDKWVQDFEFRLSNRGVMKMMAILIPEKYGVEFLELFGSEKFYRRGFVEDFMESLAWRSNESVGERTSACIDYARDCLHIEEYLNSRLRLVTIVGHPYNAEYLHKQLKRLKLRDLDAFWTIPIARLTGWNEPNTVDDIIRWAFSVPRELVSDEQAWLAALFLSWILSSNYRLLRRRASLALIRLLEQRSHIAERLVQEFHDCNDPYVVERVYAVACGVGLRECDRSKLKDLSIAVYRLMFCADEVPAHILQRDYAQAIIERAHHLGILDEEVDIERCRPPFRTKWPRIISEKVATEIESRDGWNVIRWSLKPEELGMYGDFGRYTMGSAVHHFSNQRLSKSPRKRDFFSDRFNAIIARRYILGRIRSLGWKPSIFEEYESRLAHGRMSHVEEDNKVERISKKYQWIGLHELLAFLSDHFWVRPGFSDEIRVYEGAWESWNRDFDPSHPLLDPVDMMDDENDETYQERLANAACVEFPDPFADPLLRADRSAWVGALPNDYINLLKVNGIDGLSGRWLCLSGHYNWDEKLSASQDEAQEGTLKMWTDVRCWLVPKSDREAFLNSVNGVKFNGHGCHTPELDERWIGEYPWGRKMPGVESWFEEAWWFGDDTQVGGKCYQTCCSFRDERPNFFPRLPAPLVLQIMGLEWSGQNYSYLNEAGELYALYVPLDDAVIDTTGLLVVNEDAFLKACSDADLVPLWGTLSERSCHSYESSCSIVKIWNVNQRIYEHQADGFSEVHRLDYEIPLYR